MSFRNEPIKRVEAVVIFIETDILYCIRLQRIHAEAIHAKKRIETNIHIMIRLVMWGIFDWVG
jgi:hypothetical protein